MVDGGRFTGFLDFEFPQGGDPAGTETTPTGRRCTPTAPLTIRLAAVGRGRTRR